MKNIAKEVPEHLVYEMIDGKPIYYKGFRQFLQKENINEDAIGSSLLQSTIISKLVILLHNKIGSNHHVLTNELGLLFSKGSWRAADIAIYEKSRLDISKADNKYVEVPPKIVIEVDTKADIESIKDTFAYYNEKTEQLLDFGVERVIWIFTAPKKVLFAEQGQNYQCNIELTKSGTILMCRGIKKAIFKIQFIIFS